MTGVNTRYRALLLERPNPGRDCCPTMGSDPIVGQQRADGRSHARQYRVTMSATTVGRYDINIGFFRGRAPNWTNLPISAASAAIRDSWGQLRMAPIVVVAPD